MSSQVRDTALLVIIWLIKRCLFSIKLSGKSAVLLPPPPLRTVRESVPSYGSSTYKPCSSNRASSSSFIE